MPRDHTGTDHEAYRPTSAHSSHRRTLYECSDNGNTPTLSASTRGGVRNNPTARSPALRDHTCHASEERRANRATQGRCRDHSRSRTPRGRLADDRVARDEQQQQRARQRRASCVMRAVRELNYTPNAAARSLAAAQGTRIALIYTNPSAAYLSELLVGALAGAGAHGRTARARYLGSHEPRRRAGSSAQDRAERGRGHPAAAAVRVEGRAVGAGCRRHSCGGDCVGPFPGRLVERAHRRFPRKPGNDRAPDRHGSCSASPSFAAIRIRPRAPCATKASRLR